VSRFRVMLSVSSVVITLDEKPTVVGFCTTRAVDADSAEAAIAEASRVVVRDIEPRLCGTPQSLAVKVEDVERVSWWWRRFRPPAGFTFCVVDPNVVGITYRAVEEP
jgi:hypothetical protein